MKFQPFKTAVNGAMWTSRPAWVLAVILLVVYIRKRQTTSAMRNIKTDGDVYIAGNVTTHGGAFVGR